MDFISVKLVRCCIEIWKNVKMSLLKFSIIGFCIFKLLYCNFFFSGFPGSWIFVKNKMFLMQILSMNEKSVLIVASFFFLDVCARACVAKMEAFESHDLGWILFVGPQPVTTLGLDCLVRQSLFNPFIWAQISLLQLSGFLDPPDLGDMADMPQRPCEKQSFLCHCCYFLCTDTSLLYIPGDQNCSNSPRVRGSCWGYYILQVLFCD